MSAADVIMVALSLLAVASLSIAVGARLGVRVDHEAVEHRTLVDQHGAGDHALYAVCRCHAVREVAGGRWSSLFCHRI